jgi:hypothetical protein
MNVWRPYNLNAHQERGNNFRFIFCLSLSAEREIVGAKQMQEREGKAVIKSETCIALFLFFKEGNLV